MKPKIEIFIDTRAIDGTGTEVVISRLTAVEAC